MEREQKESYQTTVENYIENNKLHDVFDKLTKQLVLSQPDDPIGYLIEHLQDTSNKKNQRIFFINSPIADKRNAIADQLTNLYGYKKIVVEDLFEEELKKVKEIKCICDDVINLGVLKAIQNVEKIHRGTIVCGYPSTFEQAVFIQQKGIIPERFFILDHSNEELISHYDGIYDKNEVQNIVLRENSDIAEVKEQYKDYYDPFDMATHYTSSIVNNIKDMIKLKDKKVVPPLISPRVVIIRPPNLKKKANELKKAIQEKYGFHSISSYGLMNWHIDNKTEVGKYIFAALRSNSGVPDDIATTLVRTEILRTISKQRGWVLEGFPINEHQLASFKTYQYNPHLVIILDDSEENLLKRLKSLKKDPIMNRLFEQDDIQVGSNLKQDRTSIEKWKEIIKIYKTYISNVNDAFKSQYIKQFSMSDDDNEKIMHDIDAHLLNNENYN